MSHDPKEVGDQYGGVADMMNNALTLFSVLRVIAMLIGSKALFHLIRDWEWIPDEGGWGTGRIVSLLFWGVVAYVVDMAMRRSIADWKILNVLQIVLVVLTISILLWLA